MELDYETWMHEEEKERLRGRLRHLTMEAGEAAERSEYYDERMNGC